MTVVQVFIVSSCSFPSETDNDGRVTREARSYSAGQRYQAPIDDARAMISVGNARAEDVPAQDRFPQGSGDSAKLLGELIALFPIPRPPTPAPQPIVPVPATEES